MLDCEVLPELVITINQSEEIEKDIECLRRAVDVLKCYPGKGEVCLTIFTEDGVTNLEMPETAVAYGLDLANALRKIQDEFGARISICCKGENNEKAYISTR